MLKSDFVAKMIEKFKAALSEVEILKASKDYDKALKVIDDTFRELFRLSAASVNSLSDDNLMAMIEFNGIIDSDRCIMISILLKEEASIYSLQNDINNSIYIYTKSLNLLLEAYLKNNTPELVSFYNEIPHILSVIDEYEISEKTNRKLFKYYDEICSFSKAEDTLYELLDATNNNSDIVSDGKAFYERLLKLEDDILEDGGLPREEVLDALNELNIK